MEQLKKVLESRMKVRFHDCDPYNHLNNSRYIDYIVSARGDQLIEYYDFDMYKLVIREGLGWVSAQTNISYLTPATLMEEVVIETRLLHFSQRSLLLEGIMWNADKCVPKSVLWTKLVHFDIRKQRSIDHSPVLIDFFQSIVHPISPEDNFEQRVNQIKARL